MSINLGPMRPQIDHTKWDIQGLFRVSADGLGIEGGRVSLVYTRRTWFADHAKIWGTYHKRRILPPLMNNSFRRIAV